MAKTISASVGRLGGKNVYTDVVTVQKLLNQVPATQGGPTKPLGVDGSCGTNTINAIQAFQIKHFGWKGADGRVDPFGQTLLKLNTFDKTEPPAPPPPPPPKPVLPTSTNFFLIHMSAKPTYNGSPLDSFFLVIDITNNKLAVYYFSNGAIPALVPAGNNWGGSGGRFIPRKPRRIDDLTTNTSAWFSTQSGGVCTSKLVLAYPEGGVQIPMNHHLIGSGGLTKGDGSVSVTGNFRLVELR